MRKFIFSILSLCLFVISCKAQITGTYQIKGADTVKMWKQGGVINPNATELVLQNNTDTVPGFLWNTGLGVTKFKRPLTKINSTTYLVGVDTLYVGAGGGGSPGGSNKYVQINYGSTFVGVNNFQFDTTLKTLLIGSTNSAGGGALYNLLVGASNISSGNYSAAFGFGNVTGAYGYAFGTGNWVNNYSLSVGNNNGNTNSYSGTIGNGLLNTYPNSLVIGQYNDTTPWPNAGTSIHPNLMPIFSVGNGTSNTSRTNVFTILRNGQVKLNLFNNSTLDSSLVVDQNGNIIQKKFISGGGGGGTLDSVGLTMPSGFTVSNSPQTGTGGTIGVSTNLTGVVHAGSGAFTGSLIVDADVSNISWGKITGTPTTVTGYGISNAARTDQTYTNPTWIGSLAWSKITGTPTSLAGYGITDPVVLTTGSYANPSWITQIAWNKITSTPTTLAGYGITDNVVNSINGFSGIVVQKSADSIKHLPVDTTSDRNGYVLAFDSLNHKFYLTAQTGGGGGGSSTFAGLTDVSVTSPANNQIPVYVSGTGKWTNTSVTTSIIAEGSNLYWTNARFDTRFASKTTDSLPQGTTNLYFTAALARGAISNTSPISYSNSTGIIGLSYGRGLTLGSGSLIADTGIMATQLWVTNHSLANTLTANHFLVGSSGGVAADAGADYTWNGTTFTHCIGCNEAANAATIQAGGSAGSLTLTTDTTYYNATASHNFKIAGTSRFVISGTGAAAFTGPSVTGPTAGANDSSLNLANTAWFWQNGIPLVWNKNHSITANGDSLKVVNGVISYVYSGQSTVNVGQGQLNEIAQNGNVFRLLQTTITTLSNYPISMQYNAKTPVAFNADTLVMWGDGGSDVPTYFYSNGTAKFGGNVTALGYYYTSGDTAATRAYARSIIVPFDSASSQGGGFHTQVYNDIRYRKTWLDSLYNGLVYDSIQLSHAGPIWGIYTTGSGRTLADKGWENNGNIWVRTNSDSSLTATLKATSLGAGSCTNCNITFDSTGRPTAIANGTGGTGSQNLTQSLSAFADTIKISNGTGYTFLPASHTQFGGVSAAEQTRLDSIITVNNSGHGFPILRSPWTMDSLIARGFGMTANNGLTATYTGNNDSISFNIGLTAVTTNGDLLYYNNGATRLPAGTTGQILTMVNGFPAWQTTSGTGTVTSFGSTTTVGTLLNINISNPNTTPFQSITLTAPCKNCYFGDSAGQNNATYRVLNLTSSEFTGQGTTTTVLHGGGVTGNPSWGAVNLGTDVTGTLLANQFPALTGVIKTTAGSLTTSFNNAVITTSAIAAGAVNLPTQVTGVLAPANGGTGNNNQGQLVFADTIKFPQINNVTFNSTGTTNITLPTSGTLLTTQGNGSGLTGITWTVAGTPNEILVNGTTGSGQSGTITLQTAQAIGTTSSPTFTNGVFTALTTSGIPYYTTGGTGFSIATIGQFPTLNQNTTGTAANLSGTPTLPNGTSAITQAAKDSSTKLASTQYVDKAVAAVSPTALGGGTYLPTITAYAGTVTVNAVDSAVWSRNGNTVTVDGWVEITSTGTGGGSAYSDIFYITLPIASHLNGHNLWGIGATSQSGPAFTNGAQGPGGITGYTTTNVAQCQFYSGTSATPGFMYWTYHFSYTIE